MWRRRRPNSAADQPPPTIDGKVVGRAVKAEIRPLLRDAGFDSFTERKAWRDTKYSIDHVTVRSYNAYSAGALGCTSYSFSVEVGVFYRCFQPDLTRPQDYNCTFRAILGKTIRQPFFGTEWGPAQDRPEVFHVLPDGSNLDSVMADAKHALVTQGLPFMERFRDPSRAFGALMTERMRDGDFGEPQVMLPGNPDSPAWRDAALSIGRLIMDDPRAAIGEAPVLRG